MSVPGLTAVITQFSQFTLKSGSTVQVLGPNPNRVTVQFSSPLGSTATVSVAANSGMLSPIGTPNHVPFASAATTNGWWATCSAGTQTIWIVEELAQPKITKPTGAYDVTAAPYNAKGDGVTDDTAAINAASLAAFNAGGNQVVWFPQGTYIISPTRTAGSGILLRSNVRYVGENQNTTTIRVKPNAGIWDKAMQNVVLGTAIINVVICNLGFDGNMLNNLQGWISESATYSYQTLIYVDAGSDIHVHNCKFSGGGVWHVSLNGSTVNCSIEFCTVYTVLNPYNQNTTTQFPVAGESPVPPTNANYDHSSFYLESNNYRVNHNVFTTAIPCNYVRAAIETHGGPCECAYNYSDGFQTIVNVVNQFNVAAVAGTQDIRIHHNKADRCMMGMRIEPLRSPNGDINGCYINDNILNVTQIQHLSNQCWGIATLNMLETTGQIFNLTITNNQVTFQDWGALGSNGVSTANPPYLPRDNVLDMAGIGIKHPLSSDYATISNNTITNAPAGAVVVGWDYPAGTNTATYNHVTVTGNTIISPGADASNLSRYRCAVDIQANAPNCVVTNNTVTDPLGRSTNFCVQSSVYTGSVPAPSLSGNTYKGAATNAVVRLSP